MTKNELFYLRDKEAKVIELQNSILDITYKSVKEVLLNKEDNKIEFVKPMLVRDKHNNIHMKSVYLDNNGVINIKREDGSRCLFLMLDAGGMIDVAEYASFN
jgi:hypothetical protein